ncbi:unnamed protein product [Rhizoctonia solani]|uniref:Protein kinase domain-containing protein n=1 Tax=Rhizoctonia solani TaxID=456999 RepID=A0A8H3GYQ6_9AGAM|nr:unnamed protein product [Rhizoctonia solani]
MTFLESQEYNLTSRITITQYLADTGGAFSDIHKNYLVRGVIAGDSRSNSLWSSLTRWKKTNQCQTQPVAIKSIRGCKGMLAVEKLRVHKRLVNEINVWHNLDHFNVLPLLGYMEGVSGTVFPSLVAPWCELGSLDKYIAHQSPRPADRISLMLQIMSAVSYLHSHTITHGDLKPENIFLQSNYQVQLSDFGLAKIPSDSTGSRFSSSNTQDAGTLRYMGPEFFANTESQQSPRGLPADIWALAWTFYMILTGLHPYAETRGAPLLQVINRIQNHKIPLEPSDVPDQNTPTEDLLRLRSTVWPIIRECWAINPIHRPKAEDVEQKLREAMLLEQSLHFDGPMFNSEVPDETRPSVIGDGKQTMVDEYGTLRGQVVLIDTRNKTDHTAASFLELKAGKLRKLNPDKARVSLVAAALGYLCYGCKYDAYTTQIQIGWILIDQHQFLGARAHFNAAQRAVGAGDLIVGCKRGLARAAVGLGNFDEAIEHYYSALVLCRAGGFVDYEYMIIRETAIAVLEHPRNQDSAEEVFKSQNTARKLFKEALSFSTDPEHVNLEYQAQVRCDLVQLESNAGNETAAQAHALGAFQCALETGRRSVADDVYNYLSETDLLSEAQLNAFRIELLDLHVTTAHAPERGVDCNPGRRPVADDVYNYLLETDVLSEAQLNAFREELLDLHSRTAHVPERGVDSLGSSWVASVS